MRTLAIVLLAAVGCATGPPEDPDRSALRRAFRKDAERCHAQTTRVLPFQCQTNIAGGMCPKPIRDPAAYELCMQDRGWEQ